MIEAIVFIILALIGLIIVCVPSLWQKFSELPFYDIVMICLYLWVCITLFKLCARVTFGKKKLTCQGGKCGLSDQKKL